MNFQRLIKSLWLLCAILRRSLILFLCADKGQLRTVKKSNYMLFKGKASRRCYIAGLILKSHNSKISIFELSSHSKRYSNSAHSALRTISEGQFDFFLLHKKSLLQDQLKWWYL